MSARSTGADILDRARIDADFAPVAAFLGVESEFWTWPQPPEKYDTGDIATAVRALAARNPSFFSRFDYAWAGDPDSYANPTEAWLQLELLIALSEMNDDHPSLTQLRPTVVRVLPIVDFASTSVRGDLCDYIVIASPHFPLLREFAVVMKELHAKATELGALEEIDSREEWVHTAAEALDVDDLHDLLQPLQRHAVNLYQQNLPPLPEQLRPWLVPELGKGNRLALEIELSYQAMDRFLLFHELAHRLAGDLHGSERSLAAELRADALALSLMVTRIGSGVDLHPGLEPWRAFPDDLAFGAPTYLHLLRIVLLFAGCYRATAAFADQLIVEAEGAIVRNTRDNLAELEVRLAQVPVVLHVYKLEEVAQRALDRTRSLHSLFNAAALKLVSEAGITPSPDDLRPFDLDAAILRLKQVVPGA